MKTAHVISLLKAKDSEDAAEKRESDPSAAAGTDETNLIDLDAGGGSAESVSNGAAAIAAADSKEAKKIAMLEGRNMSSSHLFALTSSSSSGNRITMVKCCTNSTQRN